jgi:hypothetical protein
MKFFTRIYFCLYVCCLFLSACQAQSGDNEKCVRGFKNAQKNLFNYYSNNNYKSLDSALLNIEQSALCTKTRVASVEIKISILLLMQKFEQGYKYVDSLNEKDFPLRYQKEISLNVFKAKKYESSKDTASSLKCYSEIAKVIQSYITQMQISEGLDFEARYYDLFIFKAKCFSQKQIESEIDSLTKKYPKERDFFEVLKGTIYNETKVSYPILQQ